MSSARADWATLLRRSHHLDVLDCPRCHGRLRPIAVVRDKAQARRFLTHLARPHQPLALATARSAYLDRLGPGQTELGDGVVPARELRRARRASSHLVVERAASGLGKVPF
jgi:uncharacterized protein YbaR (Trm112 family)